jgi:hypothetical protein
MVLQIEKIGEDTFDRVVYRFPLCGFLLIASITNIN